MLIFGVLDSLVFSHKGLDLAGIFIPRHASKVNPIAKIPLALRSIARFKNFLGDEFISSPFVSDERWTFQGKRR